MIKQNFPKTTTQAIHCPHCGKKDTWKNDNPTRPFCSQRCKLIDLGAWADESHRIAGEAISPPGFEW